ncbi:MAG TPA: homoserine dehydrogenase [Mobilitalea sp.]|nr:homoserine dehydrogenase [Mobilitalea sp.]
MIKELTIAFLGLGVVGSQLLEYILNNKSSILESHNIQINIGKIFVRDTKKQRSIDLSTLSLTNRPYEALENADIVIECLGGNGVELTRELVLSAIQMKKSVIMSSKKCLALYGQEIMAEVERNDTLFCYDGSVGGGIPISRVLNSIAKGEQINRIYGICNATSNYILGEMGENKVSFDTALKNARQKGYAENDVDEDVDGYDTLYKTVILTAFGLKQWVEPTKIIPKSIRNISVEDLDFAESRGTVIKSIFSIEDSLNGLSFHVGPVEVKKDSLLAAVKGNNNIIIIESSESGERAFYGQGAGARPTASAMLDDLFFILEKQL